MLAIYKRELRGFFTNLTGYIFIAAVVAFTGIYFMVNNLSYGIPYFSYTIINSLIIYIFTVPILTMRSFAEERHSKTDQLLLTSPAGVPAIVLGKYLAMITVYIIPLAILCLCPAIIRTGGVSYLLGDYMSIVCLFFVGLLFTAVGMFISSLTENQIISAVVSVIVLFVMYMWNSLVSFLPSSAFGSFCVLLILWAVITLVVWLVSRNKLITAGTGLVGAAAIFAIYMAKPDEYAGLAQKLLGAFSVSGVLQNVCYFYVFDLGGMFMLVTAAAVFVFLTIQSIQRRRGGATVLVSAMVIAIAVVLNMLAGQLPSSVTEADISGERLYSVSDASKEYLKELDEDVDLVLLAEAGSVDERISKFVYNYAALSGHLTVREVDPVMYPSSLDVYDAPANSLVVVNTATGKQAAIPFQGTDSALILYAPNYNTYQYEESQFDAEGQITSALEYVTDDTGGTVYTLTGHSEAPLSTAALGMITKANVTNGGELNLLMDGGIPEDADVIVVNDPRADLAADELTILNDYLTAGGDIVLLLDSGDMENFNALTKPYGLTVIPGYVGDTGSYFAQYAQYYGYFCMAPTMAGDLTSGITANAMVIYPKAITLTAPARDTIEVDSFMTTTEGGILYIDTTQEGVTGQYTLGATATEGDTHLTVISAASLVDEGITENFTNMSNLDIFMAAVTQGLERVSARFIPAKNLGVTYNVFQNPGFYAVLFIFILPIVCLVTGLVIWLRRRKR